MLYTQTISGQVNPLWTALKRVTPANKKKCFLAKNACMFFFCVLPILLLVLLFALVERLLFSCMQDFFYSLSKMEVGHIL